MKALRILHQNRVEKTGEVKYPRTSDIAGIGHQFASEFNFFLDLAMGYL